MLVRLLRRSRTPRSGTAARLRRSPLLSFDRLEDRAVPAQVDLAVAYNPQPGFDYVPGTSVSYTVDVTAATTPPFSGGSVVLGSATNATFSEILTGPAINKQWTAVYSGGATGPTSGTGDISVNTLLLPPGSKVTFTLSADTPSSATADLVDTATVGTSPQDTDVDTSDNGPISVDQFALQYDDLSVAYNPAAPVTYVPSRSVSYSVVLTNAGPSDSTFAAFSETLTGPGVNVRWTATYAGGATGPTSGTGDINIPFGLSIPAGGSITFVLTADTAPGDTGTFIDTAQVADQPPDPDPNLSNNGPITAVTTAAPVTDLGITNTVIPTAYTPGGSLTYTVTATNAGPSHAAGVTVTDTFTGPVAGDTWTATYSGGGTGLASGSGDINTVVVLPPGASVVFTVTLSVAPSATGDIVSVATAFPAPSGGVPPATDPDTTNNTATVSTPAVPVPPPVPPPPAPTPPQPVFYAGGEGTPGVDTSLEAVVSAYNGSGNLVQSFSPFGLAFGARPATAPVTAAGSVQVAVGSGPGVPTLVDVTDSATGTVLRSANPFDPSYTGGLNVAVGDLDGTTGTDQNPTQFVVVGADGGGGPVVVVYKATGNTLTEIDRFYAFDDPGFRGGVRVAVGNLGGGYDDLVVVSGEGGGPRVRVFDGLALSHGQLVEKASFYAFDPSFRGGGFVAVGDLYGTGSGDIIFGAGAGGGPHVSVFDGQSFTPVANFYDREATFAGGVRVAARDLDPPTPGGRATLITADGPNATPTSIDMPSQLRLWKVPDGGDTLPATPDDVITPFTEFTGGLYVG